MSEHGSDFFHVVRHENQRLDGRDALLSKAPRQTGNQPQEMFTRDWIKAGARFVEDQQPWPRHQRARNEHALTLTLGEIKPRAIRNARRSHLGQQPGCPAVIPTRRICPKVELRKFPADDRVEGGFRRRNRRCKRAGDDAHFQSQFPPVTRAIGAAED